MTRILLAISLAAASLAAKDRAWQTGNLLDKNLNPYFKALGAGVEAKSGLNTAMYDNMAVGVNTHSSSGDVIFDDFVIEGEDTVYMVEGSHFKNSKAPHVSLSLPLSFAVEKNKLWLKDLDRAEYEMQILKQVPKAGAKQHEDVIAAVEPKPEKVKPAPEKPKPAPEKPAKPEPVPVKAAPTKAEPKPDPVALALVQQQSIQAPKAEVKPPAPAPKPAPKAEAVVKEPKPAPQVATVAKLDPKPVQKPEPASKPETATARASAKDRAWQSGQLLSVVNNTYFFNVTYSSDNDGSGWPFVQGSDGRYSVNGQIGNPTTSLYTYDNYVIESQFCVYLVQRMRPKTSEPVRLPGTKALKFAVEKNRLWVLDDESKEYETKVVKLVQKDAIVDPLTRAAAR